MIFDISTIIKLILPMTSIVVLFMGCVEIYDFRIENNRSSLVIEGQISNISYQEYQDYPADGRHFTVRLSKTSDVTNVRDEMVKYATVFLLDDRGNRWDYTASEVNPGYYFLYDDEFHAEPGILYQLNVILADGKFYHSDWEMMPGMTPEPIGQISFEEVTRQNYIYKNRERVLWNTRGVEVRIDLPGVHSPDPVFYRWTFSATWEYQAVLASKLSDYYWCWITNPYYMSSYVIHKDHTGGYKKQLFFLEVDGNDRITERISILISQYGMQEGYFNYWKEIQEQDARTGLFDPPPFNLQSNLHAENPEEKVFGFFGVVDEKITRWNFSRMDLSYPVPNPWIEFCTNPNILEKARCYNCLNYELGEPTNVKPDWWDE